MQLITRACFSKSPLKLSVFLLLVIAALAQPEKIVYQFAPQPKYQPWLLVLDSTGATVTNRVYDFTDRGFCEVLPADSDDFLVVRTQRSDVGNVAGLVVNRAGHVVRDFRLSQKGECLAAMRNDNGYIFAGRSESWVPWYVATNHNGDSLWGLETPKSEFDHYLSAVFVNGAGLTTVCYRSEYEPRIVGHLFTQFIDSSGARPERPIMDVPGLCGDMRCPATLTNDGGLLVATGSEDLLWLARTDSAGEVLWRHDSLNHGVSTVSSVVSLRNGDFLLSGWQNLESGYLPKILRINGDGLLLWEKEYPQDKAEDFFRKITKASDGKFILTGISTRKKPLKRMALLAVVNADGDLLKRSVFEGPFASDFQSVFPTADGSLVLVGGWAADTISVKAQRDAIRAKSSGPH